MSKRTCPWAIALVGSVLGLAVIPTVRAEEPVVYTRVAQWQIARPNWGAYEKDLKKNTVPVMEKLLADGVIARVRGRPHHGPQPGRVHPLDLVQRQEPGWAREGARRAGRVGEQAHS